MSVILFRCPLVLEKKIHREAPVVFLSKAKKKITRITVLVRQSTYIEMKIAIIIKKVYSLH